MQVPETKLPSIHIYTVLAISVSHQGGRSFARVTHLSCVQSKIFPTMHFQSPALDRADATWQGLISKESTVQGTSTAENLWKFTQKKWGTGHRCSRPLAQRRHCPPCSFQSARCKRISSSWHLHAGAAAIRAFFPGLTSLALGLEPRLEKMSSWKGRSTEFMASPIREGSLLKPNFAVSATEDQWCHSPEVVGQSLARTPGPEKS